MVQLTFQPHPAASAPMLPAAPCHSRSPFPPPPSPPPPGPTGTAPTPSNSRGKSHVVERLDPKLRVEQVEAGVRSVGDPESDVGNQRLGVGVLLFLP